MGGADGLHEFIVRHVFGDIACGTGGDCLGEILRGFR
jgi:hypothetical protein